MVLGLVMIGVGFIAFVAYPGMQYAAVRQLRGAWLILSLVPLGVMGFVLVFTLMALADGSNLWPLMLIFTAPVATGYLLLLRFAARRLRRER